jgi:P2-related tail formation protein
VNVQSVLPTNAGPVEIAVAGAMSDHLPVPIQQIVDPARTPEAFLPWLAGHESVDLWFADWPDATKRQVIANAWTDAALKGTRQGAINFLTYVGGTLLDAIAYPRPFIVNRSPMGDPVNHPPFLARYLVNVATVEPGNAFVMGRAAVGRFATRNPDMTPINRCLTALRVARAPETQIRASFAHHRPLSIDDAPVLDAGHYLGEWVARTNL